MANEEQHNDILSRLDPKVVAAALERYDMSEINDTNSGDARKLKPSASLGSFISSNTLHPSLCSVQSSPASPR